MRFSIILVALLVLLAGCVTTGPGTTTERTTTATTSDPVGTTTVEVPSSDLAPGVDGTGIANLSELLAAHQATLLTEGFEATTTAVNQYRGNVSSRTTEHRTVGPGGEFVLTRATEFHGPDEPGVTVDAWTNATTHVVRRATGDDVTYDVDERRIPPAAEPYAAANLPRELDDVAGQYSVVGVETREGVRYVTLEAVLDRVGRNDSVADTNATLVVDENGAVHRYEVVVDYGEGNVWRLDYRLERLGVASPQPPAWLDEVPASAAWELELELRGFDATHVEIAHEGGDALPAGWLVTVVSDGDAYAGTADFGLAPGDSAFVYVDRDGVLRVATERPDGESVTELGQTVAVTVRAPDGGELFDERFGRR